MNRDEKAVRDYLELLAKLYKDKIIPKGWKYQGPTDLLLREGKFFAPPKQVTRWRHSEPQACFRNAAMYAVEHGLRYIEGYALSLIPVHHGWCADPAGNVIEVTWAKAGLAYFGLQFRPMAVSRGSVLYNPRASRSVYRRQYIHS